MKTEIAVLFTVVQRAYNKAFRVDTTPKAQGQGLQAMPRSIQGFYGLRDRINFRLDGAHLIGTQKF